MELPIMSESGHLLQAKQQPHAKECRVISQKQDLASL